MAILKKVISLRQTPDQRHALVDAVKRGIDKNLVAKVFNTTVKTVKKWTNRAHHSGRESFLDKKRRPRESKVTIDVELAILAMKTLFKWGTARIQQGLRNLPDFAKVALENTVENVILSRTAISDILKQHKLNGYLNEGKKWKFFRAKKPDELWQLDLKGPFRIQGKNYYFVICLDDYSRCILLADQHDHCPTTKEICLSLERTGRFPENILTDNGGQFKKEWTRWCRWNGIKPLFAHPYYPQDKGKVERCIRNVTEEFIKLIVKFPDWINGKICEYVKWYNEKRFHRGINTQPAKLYGKLET